MSWFLSAIIAIATLTPAPVENEPDPFPRVGLVPAADFWVLDTPYSGHWTCRAEQLYLLEWTRDEWGEWHCEATPCTPDEAMAAEQMREEYGG